MLEHLSIEGAILLSSKAFELSIGKNHHAADQNQRTANNQAQGAPPPPSANNWPTSTSTMKPTPATNSHGKLQKINPSATTSKKSVPSKKRKITLPNGNEITVYAKLKINDTLTLADISEAAFHYRLGNRSALDWVREQYKVKTDTETGITSDPNNYSTDDQYIVKLVESVTHVSVETVRLIQTLPALP